MSLHKLTAGDGYTYLTRQVAAQDATHRGYDDLGSYYSEKGETPGVWMGRGIDSSLSSVPEFRAAGPVTEAQMRALFGEGRHPNADEIERALRSAGASEKDINRGSRLGNPYKVYEQANMFHRRAAGAFRDHNLAQGLDQDNPLPPHVRAGIRSTLAATMFRETYGRDPADARELSGHLARISRQATTAVAGYDMTFSPVKSVSTLWAIAPREVSAQIEQAHHDAVKDTLTWLEDNAAYTRTGRNGVAQVKVRGLIAAAFDHRDSRAGDPDLHTHLAVSNKVQTLDGQWLALDGRPIHKNAVTASERYNTRLEAILTERLGVAFGERGDAEPGKRPIREIIGVDGELPRFWSKRRAVIDVRRAALSAQFQIDHGRPPTPNEARELAQQATTETRQNKHQPRSHSDQRTTWQAEALAVLGGEQRLGEYLRGALTRGRGAQPRQAVTPEWVQSTARNVLTTVQSSRAVWQQNHVRAETERQVRAAGIRLADLDHAVDSVVDHALSPHLSLPLSTHRPTDAIATPTVLLRADGSCVYTVAGAQMYTSAEIVAAEEAILAAASRRDGRTIDACVIDVALVEAAANGVELNPGQAAMVRELGISGARVQLALAPAGTGKTTAMRVLSRSWTDSGGDVVGLAPSAAAAAVLREEIGTHTDTLAKLVHCLETGISIPNWVTAIGPDTLVVIDEAGMAGTPDLAKAIDYVTTRGGSVRLIGDDQQLAAIGAGGVLRDIADTHGAVTLSQVMRFTDPATGAPNHAEGAASLALRDGDPAAIAYYIDNNRVHVGDLSTATDDAYTAWSADRARGLDSIMLAPTRDLVAELNDRARRDRLTAHLDQHGHGPGRNVTLGDGSHASAGDAIITRHNNRRLAISDTDWVKNGDRWRITEVRESGALAVVHHHSGLRMTLPADYVAEHVTLGYASTVHGAQGITADTSYTVATGEESRQLLYVAMTRGRHANHVHLTTAGDGDPHAVITRDALLPPTAVDILQRVLARDGSPVSAASQARALADPSALLRQAADQYHDALATAAINHLATREGAGVLDRIDAAAEDALPGLTDHDAYPALRAHLALCAVDGHDPGEQLRGALSSPRGLHDARDPAALLDWRIDPTGHRSTGTSTNVAPLPWLPSVPHALTADPEWGRYLEQRRSDVTALSREVSDRARAWTPVSVPAWARPVIERDPSLAADLAVWRAANSVEDTDRRPTGAPLPTAAAARAQRALDARVTRLLGDPGSVTARWAPLATSIDERITADAYWPTLAERLTIADRAGIDITTLACAVGAEAPLPDEQPAAALWWRLSRHLSPAATTATDHSESGTLRPPWTPALADIVGAHAAERVLADPAWPALVAAVTTATSRGRHNGWEPEQLLSTAHDLLRSGQPDDAPLRPDELTTALVWRIGMLTDTAAHPAEATAEPFADPPPIDVDRADLPDLADANPALDEAWLASLMQAEPDPVETTGPDDPQGGPQNEPSRAHNPDDLRVPDLYTDPGVQIRAALDAAEEARAFAALQEEHFWATAVVGRDRLVELNSIAETFFAAHHHDAWVPSYLRDRLGTDLADQLELRPGYAPDKWTALTEHLRRLGATDEEIVGAGLGTYASTGRVIDRFRDRLVFPIRADSPDGGDTEIHGFIGRRNPAKTDADNAGPKYLNTAETDLFHKGHELYGLSEGAATLRAGATPVLVEGPMDALAVTLAGRGDYVGIAPLGTAFTDTQADKMRRYLGFDQPGCIVATDNDTAGQQAAQRAYWQLTARNDDPHRLLLPDGKDPAELLQASGPDALRAALADSPALATSVVADRMAPFQDRLDTVEGRVFATRRAAEAIAALPPTSWPPYLADLVAKTGIGPSLALDEVLTASHQWGEDPTGTAKKRIAERVPVTDSTSLVPAATPAAAAIAGDAQSAVNPAAPAQRWAELGNSVYAGLANDPHWPALARTIDQASSGGLDVEQLLPELVGDYPLSETHTARDLEYRLIDAGGDLLLPGTPPRTAADTTRPDVAGSDVAARRAGVARSATRATPGRPDEPGRDTPAQPLAAPPATDPRPTRTGPQR